MLAGILILRSCPSLKLFDNGRDEYFGLVLVFGICVTWYALYSSRVYLMIFRFHVKLLKVAFIEWNNRFKMVLQMASTSM
jgi:hypothetical protein